MKIISHRANGTKYKENTKEAILKILTEKYVDGVEFDVRMTKDKKIVIIHDPIIDFVSDGFGFVKNFNYNDLLKYNFGSSLYPAKIALLDDVLGSINCNKIIVIEIKDNRYKEVSDIVYKIISKYNLNIYISSFNYKLIKYFKKLYNKCGLIIGYGCNRDKCYNHFDFNIVEFKYKDSVSLKETFIFTINKYKSGLDRYNVITDKPYLIYTKYNIK